MPREGLNYRPFCISLLCSWDYSLVPGGLAVEFSVYGLTGYPRLVCQIDSLPSSVGITSMCHTTPALSSVNHSLTWHRLKKVEEESQELCFFCCCCLFMVVKFIGILGCTGWPWSLCSAFLCFLHVNLSAETCRCRHSCFGSYC